VFPNRAIARISDDSHFFLIAALVLEHKLGTSIDTNEVVRNYKTRLGKHRYWPLIELMRDLQMAYDNKLSTEFLKRLGEVRILDLTSHSTACEPTDSLLYEKLPYASLSRSL